MRQRLRQKWRPPLSLVLGGSLAAVLVLPVVGVLFAAWLTPVTGGRLAGGLVVLGAGLATLILGYLLWRLILSPIQALGVRAQEIRAGAPVAPIGRVGTPEVSEVAELVLEMAETLRAREMAVRGYADHVTHEVRTPLTAIRGAAELLEADPENSEESRTLARTIIDAEKRAERLLNAAATVVRARVPEHQGETTLGDMSFRSFDGRCEVSGQEIILPIASTGLQAVLDQLIRNASEAGASRLTLEAQSDEGRPRVTITDDGAGISAGNAEKLFEPFFTTRREDGGTGMGLAVVRTLLMAHGADIRHVPSDAGATFEIAF